MLQGSQGETKNPRGLDAGLRITEELHQPESSVRLSECLIAQEFVAELSGLHCSTKVRRSP